LSKSLLDRLRCVGRHRDQHVGLLGHQFRSNRRQPVEPTAFVAVVDDNRLTFNVAEVAQALPEGVQAWRVGRRRPGREIADARDFCWLLCLSGNNRSDKH
jgi:hypothetical protein